MRQSGLAIQLNREVPVQEMMAMTMIMRKVIDARVAVIVEGTRVPVVAARRRNLQLDIAVRHDSGREWIKEKVVLSNEMKNRI